MISRDGEDGLRRGRGSAVSAANSRDRQMGMSTVCGYLAVIVGQSPANLQELWLNTVFCGSITTAVRLFTDNATPSGINSSNMQDILDAVLCVPAPISVAQNVACGVCRRAGTAMSDSCTRDVKSQRRCISILDILDLNGFVQYSRCSNEFTSLK